MLQELRIKNFALIDQATIEFDPGCNILTGETGAGKTVIVEAMNLVLGERADTTLIRSGEKEASVDGVFLLADVESTLLSEILGESLDRGSELILSRVVTIGGKSRCYINGRLVNLGLLADIGKLLVDIHGQHEHQLLLNVAEHLSYLDRYAGQTTLEARTSYQSAYKKWIEISALIDSLKQDAAEKERQTELLRFQIEEIDRASLRPDEEAILLSEREILRQSEKLFAAADAAYQSFSGLDEEGGGALDRLRAGLSELEKVAGVDDRLDQMGQALNDILYQAEDTAKLLREYREGIEFNPQRLEEIESRLSQIDLLKKKYGQSIEAVLSFRSQAKQQLESLDSSPEKIEQLEREKATVEVELAAAARSLSEARMNAAEKFETEVLSQLAELSMPKAQFKVEIRQEETKDGLMVNGKLVKLFPDGIDQAEFMISPNVGEPLKPLSKIASGGEISRIMLALKIIFGEADTIPTLIFDEVDVGIGGQTAAAVGQKLAQLSQSHQVICITHLPQIASYAASHFMVTKIEQDARTLTRVEKLDREGRVKEIARMISGTEVSEASLKHARELLDSSLKAGSTTGSSDGC